MNLTTEIQSQRDALMAGHWIQTMPNAPGHACLVAHLKQKGRNRAFVLSDEAILLVCIAIGNLYPAPMDIDWPGSWNDFIAEDFSQVIHVLDEALAYAKEIERDMR